jgi:two-component system invasion response regulator UvrY
LRLAAGLSPSPNRGATKAWGVGIVIRILVVDDHAIVREGLKQILGDVNDMVVRDEAADGQEALTKIRNSEFDVVLLDISMPGRSGLEILKEIKTERPKLPVLILSMHAEEQYAVRALRAGAFGYLTKASATDELIGAIRKVSCGRKYVSSSLAEKLALELDIDTKKPPHATLSDREYQVMLMLASGKSVKEIADELCLSVKTISTYRARLMEKMNMKKNAELTLYAIQNHLVDYTTTTLW